MKNKFYTKQGWLTPHALACGYLHRTESPGYRVTLESNNPGLNTFQVLTTVQNGKQYFQTREVFEGIQSARRAYQQYCYRQPEKRYESHPDINNYVFA